MSGSRKYDSNFLSVIDTKGIQRKAVLIAFKTRSKMAKNLQIPSETLFSFGVMMKRSAISL